MPNYRFQEKDSDGHPGASTNMVLADDGEAVLEGFRRLDRHSLEVWCELTLFATLKPIRK